MIDRTKTWFTTAHGRQFFPWAPEAHKVDIRDIAHTLSQINRWGGHSTAPYSVAQHSVVVAQQLVWAGHEIMRAGLLHDATEAYMGGDIITPVKVAMPDFGLMEAGIAAVIEERFGLPHGLLDLDEVKYADRLVRAWEYRDLMPLTLHDGEVFPRIPDGIIKGFEGRLPVGKIVPLAAPLAKAAFLSMARDLGLAS